MPSWSDDSDDRDLFVRKLVTDRGGVITYAEALAGGLARHAVRRALGTGVLRPIRRGVYTLPSLWDGATAEVRHLLKVIAQQRVHLDLVACGTSAAIIWSLPTPEGPPASPQLTARRIPSSVDGTDRRGGRGQRGGLSGRRALLADDEVETRRNGVRVTTVVRTVLDCARTWDRPWGLALADAAISSQGVDPAELVMAVTRQKTAPGARRALWVAERARPGIESPLESLARAVIVSAGLPEPTPQVWVETRAGRYRVDLLDVENRVVTEADGRGKYETAQDLWLEKRREDALRDTSLEVVRFTMADYRRPDEWLARYRRALARGEPWRGGSAAGGSAAG